MATGSALDGRVIVRPSTVTQQVRAVTFQRVAYQVEDRRACPQPSHAFTGGAFAFASL